MNNFPAMTEAQRQEVIARLLHFRKGIQVARDANIQTEADESDDLIAQITLAALTAEPVAVLYSSGEFLTKEECTDQRVFEICCRVETPLFAATPVPVLKPIELPKNTWKPCDCIDCVIAYDRDDVIAAIRAAGYEVKP